MTQAGGENIIGAMIQADEIYTLYGTRLIPICTCTILCGHALLYSTIFRFLP